MVLGVFLCMLDTTVMNIALPAIQRGLHTDLATLQWALNAYTIVFATLTIPLGRLADQLGRHKVYLLGLTGFLLGSLISGLSPNVAVLIAGRACQSVGAAIVFPTSMTIGINAVSAEKRQRAILILGLTQGLAAAFGPTFGGLITQFCGWRTLFFGNVPLILIAGIACLTLLPLRHEPTVTARIDVLGMVLASICLLTLTLPLVQGSTWGWLDWRTLALFFSCLVSLAAFILQEAHCPDPMIRLDLFKYRHFVGATLTTVASGVFFAGLMVLMPTFFTRVQGVSELTAAVMLTPATLMVLLLSPISGLLLKKVGARWLIGFGMTAMATGYTVLTRLNPAMYGQMVVAFLLIGAGYGVVIGPITVLSAGDFTGDLLTASQSVTGVFRQIGTVLAVAIFVSALSTNLTTAKAAVWHTAQRQAAQLDVTSNQRAIILDKTRKRLNNTTTATANAAPTITQKQQKQLIQQKLTQLLKRTLPHSAAIKTTMRDQVTKLITHHVQRINRQVARYQCHLQQTVKTAITAAFIRPYRIACPFVWLFILSIFIFEPRRT